MQSSFNNNLRVFYALLRRDMKILFSSIHAALIDGLFYLAVQVIIVGSLFPLLGMPKEMIAPLYLGTIAMMLFHLGFNATLKTMFDLEYTRFIDYHLTLPLPKRWLFAEYIVRNVIESAIITLPLVSFGLIPLRHVFDFSHANWFAFGLMYIFVLTFFATFFLAFTFYYPFNWFMDNAWPRRLAPMFCFSTVFFGWKALYNFSPAFGTLFLFNPLTYAVEGLRATMLGGDRFLPVPLCFAALIFFTALAVVILPSRLNKRIDPV